MCASTGTAGLKPRTSAHRRQRCRPRTPSCPPHHRTWKSGGATWRSERNARLFRAEYHEYRPRVVKVMTKGDAGDKYKTMMTFMAMSRLSRLPMLSLIPTSPMSNSLDTLDNFSASFLAEVQQVAQRLDAAAIEKMATLLAGVRERGGPPVHSGRRRQRRQRVARGQRFPQIGGH